MLKTTLLEGKRFRRNQQLRIKAVTVPQSVTCGAHSLRTVEAEELWRGCFKANSTAGTRVSRRQNPLTKTRLFLNQCDQCPLTKFQGEFDRFGDTSLNFLLDLDTIDHHVNLMSHITIQLWIFGKRHDFTVDSRSNKSLLQQIGEAVPMFTLLLSNDRGQQTELCARR